MRLPVVHFASFLSGLIIAIGGVTMIHHSNPPKKNIIVIKKPNTSQVLQLQAQNKALCTQLRIHHLAVPKNVKC